MYQSFETCVMINENKMLIFLRSLVDSLAFEVTESS